MNTISLYPFAIHSCKHVSNFSISISGQGVFETRSWLFVVHYWAHFLPYLFLVPSLNLPTLSPSCFFLILEFRFPMMMVRSCNLDLIFTNYRVILFLKPCTFRAQASMTLLQILFFFICKLPWACFLSRIVDIDK